MPVSHQRDLAGRKRGKSFDGPRTRIPWRTALSGSTATANPAKTAAPTAFEFQLEYSTR